MKIRRCEQKPRLEDETSKSERKESLKRGLAAERLRLEGFVSLTLENQSDALPLVSFSG